MKIIAFTAIEHGSTIQSSPVHLKRKPCIIVIRGFFVGTIIFDFFIRSREVQIRITYRALLLIHQSKLQMRKISSLLFAFILSGYSYSQTNDSIEKESLIITVKPSLGFNIGADYSLVKNYSSIDSFAAYPTSVYNAPGFRLGVFGDVKIQERFTLIPRAELSFNFTTVQQNGETLKLDPFNLDFMLHAKWNFKKRDSKVNPYCYLGPGLRVPLNSNSEGNFDTKKAWSGDISLGLDLELKWFYLSPEIRYSHGLQNIKNEDSWEKIRGSYTAFVLSFTGK